MNLLDFTSVENSLEIIFFKEMNWLNMLKKIHFNCTDTDSL